MEKNQLSYPFPVICSIFIALGLVAFSACIAAEITRTRSPAFGLGVLALICLLVAQIIGNMMIGCQFSLKEKKTSDQPNKQRIALFIPAALSWVSFGLAIILLGTATSMSQRQAYGKGWIDGECYFVKGGIYAGSGALVLATESLILGSLFTGTRTRHQKKQVDEQEMKVHA